MKTLDPCRRELDEALAEHAEPIAELTATVCEDGATCLIELADQTTVACCFDWPLGRPFDDSAILDELARLSPSACIH